MCVCLRQLLLGLPSALFVVVALLVFVTQPVCCSGGQTLEAPTEALSHAWRPLPPHGAPVSDGKRYLSVLPEEKLQTVAPSNFWII